MVVLKIKVDHNMLKTRLHIVQLRGVDVLELGVHDPLRTWNILNTIVADSRFVRPELRRSLVLVGVLRWLIRTHPIKYRLGVIENKSESRLLRNLDLELIGHEP